MKNFLLFIFIIIAIPFPVSAEDIELQYDDGTPSGVVQNLKIGDVEVTRLTPLHPAFIKTISIWFGRANSDTTIYIWGDNGGNAPDLANVLWSKSVTPVDGDWTTIDLSSSPVNIDPPIHFYVGHIVEDASTLFSWDSTGSDEARSLIRTDGDWYFVGDGSDNPKAVDALVRATVEYHDIPEFYTFEDITSNLGMEQMSRVAWGDYDNDGFDDLLVNGNRLFHNNHDTTFTEVSETAGISGQSTNGGVWADYDNDGFLDFYATCNNYLPACETNDECTADGYSCVDNRCKSDSNPGESAHDILYHNNGDGTFTDVSFESGAYDYLPSEGAAWADINSDGFVDLYVANYETPVNWTNGELSVGTRDYLWINQGDGTFKDYSDLLGISLTTPLCGRGVNFGDYNDDGAIDLFVSNYRLDPNLFFKNAGNGRFTNISYENGTAGVLISGAFGHTIGSSWGDFNNDGYFDLITANLAHPRFIEFSDKTMLYINQGPPDFDFDEIREESGITYSETHSDTALGDIDNDGFLDLFITDIYTGYQSFLYKNNKDLSFTDITYPSGIRIDNGWGCAFSDIDNDGDLDFVSRKLYLNNPPQPSGNWLKVKLIGTSSNAAAIGAVVKIENHGETQVRQVEGGKGTTTQNSLTLHFGLGDATMVEKLSIRWPIYPPHTETYENITPNRVATYVEYEGERLPDGGTDDATPVNSEPTGCSCTHVGGQNSSGAPKIPLLLIFMIIIIGYIRFYSLKV